MLNSTRSARRALSMFARLIAGVVLAVCLSCSNGSQGTDGPTTSAAVGSKGGKVEIPGTGGVVVPPGALDGDVTVGMAVVDPPVLPPAPAESKVVAFTPHGLELKLPAKISLHYESTAPINRLSVLRLANASAKTWEQVGGVKFSGGFATFETMTFSYYVVVNAPCTPLSDPACSASCECCGTASCVDIKTSPKNCGACGNNCGGDAYCNSAATCTKIPGSRLCDNKNLYVILGELPDLGVVSPEQTTDPASAASMASAIISQCGLPPATTLSQATSGVLDPCTDAPLQTGGTTDLIAGGAWSQRVARFLEANSLAPYRLQDNPANGTTAFVNRGGQHIVDFPASAINPTHDYFVIALIPEVERGALILHVFGVGWEGTPAAVYYFNNVALPQIVSGTRTWQHNLLVEWTDDGDGLKDAGDTFKIISQDQ